MPALLRLGLICTVILAGCSGPGPDVPAPEPTTGVASPRAAADTKEIALVRGEARVLRGQVMQSLVHPIENVLAAYGFDENGQRVDYAVGKDLIVSDDGIARSAHSRIPDFGSFTYSTAHPCDRALFSGACARAIARCPTGGERCKEEHDGAPSFWFALNPRTPAPNLHHVVYVDYEARIGDPVIPSTPIAESIANVVCLGDSIGTGAHTSESYFRQSDELSWCKRLDRALGSEVRVENRSIGGATIATLEGVYQRLEGTKPDVAIFAVGMNDHVEGPDNLEEFEARLEALARQAIADGTRPLFVGFFEQNPLWVEELPSDTAAYNKAIERVANRLDAPFVDIAAEFARATPTHAPYYHLTGDYMHHPNDYGQRVYFSAILPYFIAEPTAASAVPDYVVLP